MTVESVNIMSKQEKTLHEDGEEIRVSSYYASSTDPISKTNIVESTEANIDTDIAKTLCAETKQNNPSMNMRLNHKHCLWRFKGKKSGHFSAWKN